jgi:hypothetical protein
MRLTHFSSNIFLIIFLYTFCMYICNCILIPKLSKLKYLYHAPIQLVGADQNINVSKLQWCCLGIKIQLHIYIQKVYKKMIKKMFDEKWVSLMSRWNYEEIDGPDCLYLYTRWRSNKEGRVEIPLTGLAHIGFCHVPTITWNYKLSVG